MSDVIPPADLGPTPSPNPGPNRGSGSGQAPPQVVIQNIPPKTSTFGKFFYRLVLGFSILLNVLLLMSLLSAGSLFYAANIQNQRYVSGSKTATHKIAIIKVSDMITSDSVKDPIKELKHAAANDNIKAVVLAVDTPGGTLGGSDELYHQILKFKETKKPIVVSMQGMATSGGYYISVPADFIYAERSCLTGSIGVIASFFNAKKLLEKVGVESNPVVSGKMKDSGSPFKEMSPEERKYWQGLIDKMFEQFLGVIDKNRSQKIGGMEKLKELADGRVYLASEALELKLIDAIGYQNDAVAKAKELAIGNKTLTENDEVMVITYQRASPLLEGLIGAESKAPHMQQRLLKMLSLCSSQPMLLPPRFLPFDAP